MFPRSLEASKVIGLLAQCSECVCLGTTCYKWGTRTDIYPSSFSFLYIKQTILSGCTKSVFLGSRFDLLGQKSTEFKKRRTIRQRKLWRYKTASSATHFNPYAKNRSYGKYLKHFKKIFPDEVKKFLYLDYSTVTKVCNKVITAFATHLQKQ